MNEEAITILEDMLHAQHQMICSINNVLPIPGFGRHIELMEEMGDKFDKIKRNSTKPPTSI